MSAAWLPMFVAAALGPPVQQIHNRYLPHDKRPHQVVYRYKSPDGVKNEMMLEFHNRDDCQPFVKETINGKQVIMLPISYRVCGDDERWPPFWEEVNPQKDISMYAEAFNKQ
jgi:hypothetical protein